MNSIPIDELLSYIDPSILEYQEWVAVGMALKDAGQSVHVWDEWSRRDTKRYHQGDCDVKWKSFKGNGKPITEGTLVKFAKDHGWRPDKKHHELEWDSFIGGGHDELKIVNHEWIEGKDIPESNNPPHIDLINYIDALFQSDDYVGYVTQSWWNEKAQKHLPQKGNFDRTAGQLIQELNKCGGDIGKVIGDCNPEVGAWIRFNPLDGKGVRDENVTEFRYALIESDDIDIDKQYTLIRELELPAAAIVHSGGKSIHAIVHIDAMNMEEYRKRVDWLYEVCGRNGLKIDRQNRNPSRLSRMPGVTRNGNKQYLIARNVGKTSYAEWKEWIQDLNDDLPDMEPLSSVWNNLPDLAQPLISGLLRQGHKMLLAGPSKAGKSYALIELCIAIAEGKRWIAWNCTKGRVLYVNLELDRASCLHRFKDVYAALGWPPDHIDDIDIWNLRGSAVPMDKLTPKLIRRSIKKRYTAIIIDPIYKVITGDENSAEQMAHFCNQFDKLCNELGAAAIYCHHHSKGQQGQKMSRDRASGSGVFARDPDTLLDMIELAISDDRRKAIEETYVHSALIKYLHRFNPQHDYSGMNNDDLFRDAELVPGQPKDQLPNYVNAVRNAVAQLSGWRIEGTLREFPRFDPVSLFFQFPRHLLDDDDFLKDAKAAGEEPPWMEKRKSKKEAAKSKHDEAIESLETGFNACMIEGKVTVKALSEYLGITEKSIRRRVSSSEKFKIKNGEVFCDEPGA